MQQRSQVNFDHWLLFSVTAILALGFVMVASASAPVAEVASSSALEAAVLAMNPDALSPREALEALYLLKGLVAKS